MVIKPDIHQTVIIPPAISMDDAFGVDLAANNGLQRGFRCNRYHLAVDAVSALEQTKDNRFAVCSTSKLARNSFEVKLGFIDFNLAHQGRLSCTGLGHMDTGTLVNAVSAASRKPSQFAVSLAVRFIANRRTICRNMASLILNSRNNCFSQSFQEVSLC